MPLQIRILFASLILGIASLVGAQTPHTHEHSFAGADSWAKVFDDPERDRWQKPHEVILAMKLAPDSKIADIGAGTGYFATRLAHMTPNGRVYAVDIEPDMVKYLAERAKRDGLKNLQPVQAKPDDAALPERMDRILLVDTYHHITDRVTYFRRLRSSLAPGGQVAIIDFTKDSPLGPPRSDRIASESVVAEMKAAGYALVASHGILPYQYFLVFQAQL
ncbi:MAG TPA: class I SAM-dependent methyltransferase [Burkholderiaceae bacterium]|nr:class I SAM-dependent methyltransferase [Burkholderiaceae bacterium]